MKEDITRKVRPCRRCGEPTAEYDGYCDTCFPPDDKTQPDGTINDDLLGRWQTGEVTL